MLKAFVDGVAKQPDFHDGLLTGIVLIDDGCRIYLTDTSDAEWELFIPEVERLHASNFLAGNIIFDYNVYSSGDIYENLVATVYGVSSGSEFHKQAISTIASKGWTLASISSSIGCELTILSRASSDSEFSLQLVGARSSLPVEPRDE